MRCDKSIRFVPWQESNYGFDFIWQWIVRSEIRCIVSRGDTSEHFEQQDYFKQKRKRIHFSILKNRHQ